MYREICLRRYFFIAAASLFPDSNVLIHNVGLNPTRTAILDLFASMGAAIQILGLKSAHEEVVGDLAVKGASLKGGVIAGDQIPLVIDELPMLAALGPYTEEGIEIRDAAELRVKESDRIAALVENLRRMGASVEERPDGLKVEGRRAGKLRAPKSSRAEITYRHGVRRRGPGSRGIHHDSRRRLRRRFLSHIFSGIEPSRRALG